MREVTKKIQTLIEDEKNQADLTLPVCAFITFMDDEGKNEALRYSMPQPWYKKVSASS